MFAGYAVIKKKTSTHQGLGEASDFEKRLVRCATIAPDGKVVVHREDIGFASFEAQDVQAFVKLDMVDGFVCPPNLTPAQRSSWLTQAIQKSNHDRASFNAYYTAQAIEKGAAITDFFDE